VLALEIPGNHRIKKRRVKKKEKKKKKTEKRHITRKKKGKVFNEKKQEMTRHIIAPA